VRGEQRGASATRIPQPPDTSEHAAPWSAPKANPALGSPPRVRRGVGVEIEPQPVWISRSCADVPHRQPPKQLVALEGSALRTTSITLSGRPRLLGNCRPAARGEGDVSGFGGHRRE